MVKGAYNSVESPVPMATDRYEKNGKKTRKRGLRGGGNKNLGVWRIKL